MTAKPPFDPTLQFTGSVDENDLVTLTDANGKTHTEKVPGAYLAVTSGNAGMSVGYDVRGDISCVSVPVARSPSLVIPILRNHDHASPPIGMLIVSGRRLVGELQTGVTREDLFRTFGGAGIRVLEQEIRTDENTGRMETLIRKFEVMEFSLCPVPSQCGVQL